MKLTKSEKNIAVGLGILFLIHCLRQRSTTTTVMQNSDPVLSDDNGFVDNGLINTGSTNTVSTGQQQPSGTLVTDIIQGRGTDTPIIIGGRGGII